MNRIMKIFKNKINKRQLIQTKFSQKYKRNDIEKAVTRLFCKTCGTAIGTQNPMRPDSIILKVGTFDNPSIFEPSIAIFTSDKQKFHYIDKNIRSFDKRP